MSGASGRSAATPRDRGRSVISSVVQVEIGRLVRRRATIWILLVCFLLVGLPALVVAPSFVLSENIGITEIHEHTSVVATLALMVTILELVVLSALTYYLAFDSLRDEIDRGTLHLLDQTPTPTSTVVLGKGIGVALFSLALHSFCWIFLLLPTPLLRRGALPVIASFVGIWLYAIGFIPEGFGSAALGLKRHAGTYFAFRIGSVVRLFLPFALVGFFILPEMRELGVGPREVLVEILRANPIERPWSPESVFSHRAVPVAVFLTWQLSTALLLVLWLRRQLKR